MLNYLIAYTGLYNYTYRYVLYHLNSTHFNRTHNLIYCSFLINDCRRLFYSSIQHLTSFDVFDRIA
jgi:hypothetical protein